MMLRNTYFLMLLLFVGIILMSCDHKELCFDHAHTADVKVKFDWSDYPYAHPVSMTLYLFPKDTGEPLRYDFGGRNGGIARIPIGSYSAICMNGDTENILCREVSASHTFEITTKSAELLYPLATLGVRSETAPRAEGTTTERIALPPDELWTYFHNEISQVNGVFPSEITLKPKLSISNIKFVIDHVVNLKYISGVSASISSVSGGYMPGIGALSQEIVTVPFDMYASSDNLTLTGEVRIFGHCNGPKRKHILTVYAVLADGSKWYYTFDVTDKLHAHGDGVEMEIRIHELHFPKPIVNGGGFHPQVDDWQQIDINIDM